MLSEIEGEGWVVVGPPMPSDDTSTVARYNGEPLNAGFLTETITDNSEEYHVKYRSGQYDLEIKMDFQIERVQARVERAEGYEQSRKVPEAD